MKLSSETKTSGSPLNSGDAMRHRWRILHKIKYASFAYRRNLPASRGRLAMTLGFVAFSSVVLLGYGAERFADIEVPQNVLLLCGALAGLFTGLLVKQFSARAVTFTDEVCRLLADYPPVSVDDYKVLQEAVRSAGFLKLDDLHLWLALEQDAIANQRTPRNPTSSVSSFINKNL